MKEWIEENGWVSGDGHWSGEAGEKGNSWECRRLERLENGEGSSKGGLIFRFSDPLHARRVARVHQPEHGPQLFAIPELIAAGEDWCLMEDIAGAPMSAVGPLGTLTTPAIAEQAGVLLRKLHGQSAPERYGDIIAEETQTQGRRSWKTFNGYVAAHLDGFVDRVNTGDFDDEVRSMLLEVLGDLRQGLSAFLPRQPAALNHGGFGPRNLWVDPIRGEIIGLTGFERASYLPKGMDIAYLFYVVGLLHHDESVRAFYTGYGAARTMDVQRREKYYGRLVLFETLFGLRDPLGATREALVSAICNRTPL